MEYLLAQLGITGGANVLLFFIMQKMLKHKTQELEKKNGEIIKLQEEATKHRKEERDQKMQHQKEEQDLKLQHLKEEFYLKLQHQNEEQYTRIKSIEQKTEALQTFCEKSMAKHDNLQKIVCEKIDSSAKSIYERFNPMVDGMNKLLGYMEGLGKK